MRPVPGGITGDRNPVPGLERTRGPSSRNQVARACEFAFPLLNLALGVLNFEFHHRMRIHEMEVRYDSLEIYLGLRLEDCPAVVAAGQARKQERADAAYQEHKQCCFHCCPFWIVGAGPSSIHRSRSQT